MCAAPQVLFTGPLCLLPSVLSVGAGGLGARGGAGGSQTPAEREHSPRGCWPAFLRELERSDPEQSGRSRKGSQSRGLGQPPGPAARGGAGGSRGSPDSSATESGTHHSNHIPNSLRPAEYEREREREESLDSSTGCYAPHADHCCRKRAGSDPAGSGEERESAGTQEKAQPPPRQTPQRSPPALPCQEGAGLRALVATPKQSPIRVAQKCLPSRGKGCGGPRATKSKKVSSWLQCSASPYTCASSLFSWKSTGL